MMKTILIGTLALAATVPANAQVETRVVRYDDLNLTRKAGMDRFGQRIRSAARAVCSVSTGRVAVGEVARTRECVAKAKAGADRQVGALDRDTALGG